MKEIGLNDPSWQHVLEFAMNILGQPVTHAEENRAYLAAATSVHIAKRMDDAIVALRKTIIDSTHVSDENARKRSNRLEEKMDALTGALDRASTTLVTTLNAAGQESAELSRKIHRLNVVLTVIAAIAAIATLTQAYAAIMGLK